MLVVGITGGLATGKSLVTRRLQALGAVTFSADEAARAVLTAALLEQIAQAFGDDILDVEGGLNRAALARRVFADPEARTALQRITHPPILRLLRAQIDAAAVDLAPSTVICVEVPLLYEAHLQNWFERIVMVTTSETVQIARLNARNNLDETEARRRLAAQWPLDTKCALADRVIYNDGDVTQLCREVDELWAWLSEQSRIFGGRA